MKRQFTFYLLATLLIVNSLIFPSTVFSATIYVNKTAVGTNNGSSWANAFTNLSNALQVAVSGDEIWIAAGVYKPEVLHDFNSNSDTDPREAVFILPDGVALYGGFTGTEINLEERDWASNWTILSGDIDNNDINVDLNFIAENTSHVVGNNSYHVVYTENVSASTRIDGLIITAGKANISVPINPSDPNLDGGGLFNRISTPTNTSNPTIANSSFIGNYASSDGGAIFNTPGIGIAEIILQIDNCLFSGNKSNFAGGAIYIGSFSPGNYQALISNCQFIDNEAYRRGGALYLLGDNSQLNSSNFENNKVTVVSEDMSTLPGSGGAINLVSSNAVVVSCQFIGNTTTGNPTGAFEGGGGGAIYASTNEPQTASLGPSEPKFISCGFYQNEATGNTTAWGGAITNLNDAGILRPKYINCVFSENMAQNHGGAVANFTRIINGPEGFTATLNPIFTNCTFYGNNAGQNGGALYFLGYVFEGSQVLESLIENSILSGNTSGALGNQIYSTGDNVVNYSLVEGSGGSGAGWNTSLGTDDGNNIDLNPQFTNSANPFGADNIPGTSDDGLMVLNTSSVLNAGNNSALGLAGITTDFTGAARVLSSTIDMGAYERAGLIIPKLDIFWLEDWPDFKPPCLSCPLPWSFLLFTDFRNKPQFVWNGPAQFIIKDDIAIITGDIVNYSNPELTFKVHIKLVKPMDWENWSKRNGSYFAETKEAKSAAKKEHKNWKYWKLSNDSFIEGTGEIKGSLKLKPYKTSDKTAFQVGIGANAWDSDFGIGGNFTFNGKLYYKNKKLQVKGLGSANVDAILCENQCEPLIKDLFAENKPNLKSAAISDNHEENHFNIYPVPANDFLNIEINPKMNSISVISIIDMMGREMYKRNLSDSESKISIPLKNLNSGIYILKISRDSSSTKTKRFIKY
jgi:hypothetical protein